jgi:hypothetical protein
MRASTPNAEDVFGDLLHAQFFEAPELRTEAADAFV